MADSKSNYSEISEFYVNEIVPSSSTKEAQFRKSKNRESQYNENWKKQSVNLNEIVSQFAPESNGKMHGVKCEFRGEKYIVKADLASGYLRIYSKKEKKYVKLDGNPGTRNETHFKILKREEM